MATPNQVPAAPVRAYVQGLIDAGMTRAAIREASGVPRGYVGALLRAELTQLTLSADRAEQLLGVRFEAPPVSEPTTCAWSEAFQPVGYRVGRCEVCGQFAQIQTREGRAVLVSHPRLVAGATGLAAPAAFAEHPDCGSPRGHQRHVRVGTPACELCKAAKSGYDQGRTSALSAIRQAQQGAVPWSLVAECEAAARAVVFRRAYPQLRELSVRVLRAVEAAREASVELDALLADARAVAA